MGKRMKEESVVYCSKCDQIRDGEQYRACSMRGRYKKWNTILGLNPESNRPHGKPRHNMGGAELDLS
jgi:hypothetical protein